jgi:hypothetical protein
MTEGWRKLHNGDFSRRISFIRRLLSELSNEGG